ncbi:choline dehydrogenase-like flavoprotein [Friedmanniella endophytica]|uniref:Choline dehydrogenase-like flavoprotein n=1 Tax=Microlunatus kandeliicorticis TaxID=1759536 RepID=A0A7W3P7Q8_9ACTN|nr:GMC oxidoreductase [Microlunatus kandeliicorticis]MBA8796245.1 choline dehydrogenase-like flavoprotein [Microlunatus kandeliicorticis]
MSTDHPTRRDENSDRDEHVDVLIVGSGPAGATYARTLGDLVPHARVLMVEVGPVVPGVRGDHTQNMTDEERTAAQLLTQGPDAGRHRAAALADIAPGIDPSLEFRQTILPGLFFVDPRPALEPGEVGLPAASMASGVGGMGIHWGTSSPRPQQSERIPFIPGDELDAALDHAEQLLGTTTHPVPGEGLPEAVRSAVADVLDGPDTLPTRFMPTSTRWVDGSLRFAGTGAILGELEATAPGFALRAETLATRILVEEGVAVGAVLRDRRSGAEYTVRADHVVVCADGLRTPQLLWASGIRPAALGHHLNEHFQMASFLMLGDEFDPDRIDTDPQNVASVLVPFSDARPFQLGVITLANSAYKIALGDGADDPSMRRLAVIACYGAKDVRFGDAVEFSDTETDFYGMPRMRIRYTRTEADLALIERMRAASRAVIDRLGQAPEEPELAAGGSSLHYQGTVRMGPVDDGTSVCDSLLRVWGVDRLQVGGNGVIPTSTASNPTLTTVALAWRAATALAAELAGRDAATSGTTATERVVAG